MLVGIAREGNLKHGNIRSYLDEKLMMITEPFFFGESSGKSVDLIRPKMKKRVINARG